MPFCVEIPGPALKMPGSAASEAAGDGPPPALALPGGPNYDCRLIHGTAACTDFVSSFRD